MQTVGPYRLLQALGTCQVGGVWSATDALNNQVTVAVLSANAGRDPGWRSAFAAAANGLVQAGRLPMVTADYSAVTPWIAAAASDGSVVAQVFVTLGMSYQPLSTEPGEPAARGPVAPEEPFDAVPPRPVDDEPTTTALPPQPVSGAPASASARVSPPVSSPPASVVPPRPVSPPPTWTVPPQPVSAPPASTVSPPPASMVPPQPVSAPPTSVASQPAATVAPQPMAGMPSPTVPAASPYDAFPAGPGDSGGSRRRTGLLVGAVLVGLVALGGGGGAVALAMRSDSGGPEPTPSPPASSAFAAPEPATQPGIEPPLDGQWPTDWPTFEEQEATPMTDLAGVGFPFEVPAGWSCTPVTTTEDVAHYRCGPGGEGEQVGGDLIVRTCPDPCDAERRVEMRRAEEAWGLQWVRDSGYRSWAQTDELENEPRYALVLVGYWRTAPEGRLDRQLVLRMTAPPEQTDEVRKAAGSVRDAIRALTPG